MKGHKYQQAGMKSTSILSLFFRLKVGGTTMTHIITIIGHEATCTCGFEVDLAADENPRGKIEAHGKENDFKVLVNDMSV